MGWKTNDHNSMLLCKSHETERSVAVVTIENDKAIISGIVETLGCSRGEILFEPKRTKFLISPAIG